jgi:Fe-S oxidoreductase/nitrate reductase gamma subunit
MDGVGSDLCSADGKCIIDFDGWFCIMIPTREVYWNINRVWLMYIFLIPTLLIFAYGVYRRCRLWRLGKSSERFEAVLERLKGVLVYGFGQTRLLRSRYAGIFHLFFFFGFVILFIGTLVVLIHEDMGLRIMQGNFYLYFQSLALDLFGLLAVVGILMAGFRRYFLKPARLHNTWQDALILGSLLVILLTGFVLEGLRISATRDPWAQWSPVGLATGRLFEALFPEHVLAPLHEFLWWFHLILVFAIIAWLPYSKLFHIITGMANVYFRSLEPKGTMLKPVNMDAASFGVNKLDQFTWKDLLDLDACTECGRCQDVCPAFATDQPLSPKTLILDLRDHLHAGDLKLHGGDGSGELNASSLIGEVIKEETLWACTTCMACIEECPVFIEQVPKIVDMRRQLVMEEGRLPGSMEQALRNLETRGHPYAGLSGSRLDWCHGLNVKVLSGGDRAEYLYWVGCSTSLNSRNQKVARAFSRLLQQAGVDFAILGEKEYCSGDPARRMGNDYLFDMLARRNIEILQSHRVEKIVTTCPHCFNSLKNEYPRLGGKFEVYHHSQILSTLVREGGLKASDAIDTKITYHDPCYLGRYNDVYEEPRELMTLAAGCGVAEMEQCRKRSFCCGAGGGLMWAEESNSKRINNERARQALETEAGILTVACPFCMIMMEDGIKNLGADQRMAVLDIAEVLEGPNDA